MGYSQWRVRRWPKAKFKFSCQLLQNCWLQVSALLPTLHIYSCFTLFVLSFKVPHTSLQLWDQLYPLQSICGQFLIKNSGHHFGGQILCCERMWNSEEKFSKKMPLTCALCCMNRIHRCKEKSFFRIPADVDERQKWIMLSIKKTGSLLCTRVCVATVSSLVHTIL